MHSQKKVNRTQGLKHSHYGIELSIICLTIVISVIVTASLAYCGATSSTQYAFVLGFTIGVVLVYYLIRIRVVKLLKREWNNDSLEYIIKK